MYKCRHCRGTGTISEPADQEEFNRWYKKYRDAGQLNADSCRYFASLKVKMVSIACPYCRKLF